jgi:hypothetical protein
MQFGLAMLHDSGAFGAYRLEATTICDELTKIFRIMIEPVSSPARPTLRDGL